MTREEGKGRGKEGKKGGRAKREIPRHINYPTRGSESTWLVSHPGKGGRGGKRREASAEAGSV